ncbi:MAG TPA: RNA 3'-terminal phosphate cyclase [Archangium sp.]|nr:RNA 3'-terminal phosphate cyclase [Archangium sp.]HYO51744.1 RNA 3'-terminal phosphate cyclase [Archangium sp.]
MFDCSCPTTSENEPQVKLAPRARWRVPVERQPKLGAGDRRQRRGANPSTLGPVKRQPKELHSKELTFRPRSLKSGDYHFAVGTAGSATLVLQTLLLALLAASGPSTLVLEGGTHNPAAPPFDFLASGPLLRSRDVACRRRFMNWASRLRHCIKRLNWLVGILGQRVSCAVTCTLFVRSAITPHIRCQTDRGFSEG